jgi:hypothetical protein
MKDHIELYHYDPKKECLSVMFQGGSIYDFMAVSKDQYDTISQGQDFESKTKAVQTLIRSGIVVGVRRVNHGN